MTFDGQMETNTEFEHLLRFVLCATEYVWVLYCRLDSFRIYT